MKKTKNKKTSSSKGGGKPVDFGKYLRGLNRHLDKAKEAAENSGFDEYDDGRYRMRAVDAKIGVSKNKRVQVILSWKFMDGDYKGKEKLDFEGLTEDHLPYLLKKLDAMGYDTSELEDLEAELKDILADIKKTKPKCKVRLKTKGEFQNLYVDGILGEDDEDEDDGDEDEDEDDSKKSKSKSKKKSKKSKDDDDDEDEEEDEDSDEEEESDDDEEESDDEESEDEDEEEDEEEEEKPKKGKKKSKSKKDDDEDDEEEEESDEDDDEEEEVEDEIDVVVGSIVKADSKKLGKLKGEVVELFEAEGKVLIKTDKGKTVKIKADSITSVEESPAESVPKKKKKSKK